MKHSKLCLNQLPLFEYFNSGYISLPRKLRFVSLFVRLFACLPARLLKKDVDEFMDVWKNKKFLIRIWDDLDAEPDTELLAAQRS